MVGQRGGDAHQERQREHTGARGAAAPAYDGDAVPHRGGAGDGLAVGDLLGVLAEGAAEVGQGVHRGSPSDSASAGSIRSLASALLHWLLTVPTEQPSSPAVCTSVRSSK